MRHRIARFASILSLLLCVTAVCLWIRSYWQCYDIEWPDGSLVSSRGILFYQFSFLSGSKPQTGLRFHSLDAFYVPSGFSGPNYLYLHFAGITFVRGGKHILQISIPFWAILLLSGSMSFSLNLLPAGHRRSKEETCHSCGYNLTGNVSGVCPECGTRI